ncbi:MAG: ABC transporter ATP-binding protein [Bacteroidia bacterium]|jgi:lipopolysaccharide transport system ATP-binding protein|nr:ABC transporter ATP-binding protein [Bacteroidia bacterium]
MRNVIEVEHVYKSYRLGVIGTGTLSHDLNRWLARMRGKEDPYKQVGVENNRTVAGGQYVNALSDISFSVAEGEVLGIIGGNGAGKSTLLKLLSRVTQPSEGEIRIRGRLASLLEVGTGFHPDLTGRENIFLNGTILGMKKAEVQKHFDEIVEFAGVAKYVDTPIKRYSSGMKVRLGFAVAAHLEPEVLVVDEVLAVGDAEFQRKCLGKMQDVAENQGRTILFVSHNMNAINRLCTRGIVLRSGKMAFDGTAAEAVRLYEVLNSEELKAEASFTPDHTADCQIVQAQLTNLTTGKAERNIGIGQPFGVNYTLQLNTLIRSIHMTMVIKTAAGEIVFLSDRRDDPEALQPRDPGTYTGEIQIPNPLLVPGTYTITLGLINYDNGKFFHAKDILTFTLADNESARAQRAGQIFVPLKWNIEKK